MNNTSIKSELFHTRDKAIKFMRKVVGGKLHHYAPDSKTRAEYIRIFELREGCFDADFAELFPYCVSYVEIE